MRGMGLELLGDPIGFRPVHTISTYSYCILRLSLSLVLLCLAVTSTAYTQATSLASLPL
jgi:hypothetical protein